MSLDFLHRTKLILNENQIQKLQQTSIAIFGLGGVGGYALEGIARAGIGTIILVDGDRIDVTNINRQILTDHSNIGRLKTDAAEERLKKINPNIKIYKIDTFISKQNLVLLESLPIQFAIDAIDSVNDKVDLLEYLYHKHIPVISCMGAGWKTNPLAITSADISQTHTCPLAKTVRKKLAERNILRGITCVFSTEKTKTSIGPIHPSNPSQSKEIGSISYIPGIIGLISAGLLIQKIIEK